MFGKLIINYSIFITLSDIKFIVYQLMVLSLGKLSLGIVTSKNWVDFHIQGTKQWNEQTMMYYQYYLKIKAMLGYYKH